MLVCLYKVCLHCRNPNNPEKYIYVGNGEKVQVDAIGTFRLLLKIGFYLDLNETKVVPSLRRNLISISILDKFGYSYSFGDGKFSLFHNSKLVGFGSLSSYDNIYKLPLHHLMKHCMLVMHVSTRGIKSKLTNENSSSL